MENVIQKARELRLGLQLIEEKAASLRACALSLQQNAQSLVEELKIIEDQENFKKEREATLKAEMLKAVKYAGNSPVIVIAENEAFPGSKEIKIPADSVLQKSAPPYAILTGKETAHA